MLEKKRMFKVGCYLLSGLLLIQSVSCGTILYPDRHGQEGRGSVDWGVVALDGVGLFFFLVPGLIAFAVDFATGAIYLPPWEKNIFSQTDLDNGDCIKVVFADKSLMTKENIEKVVKQYTKKEFSLNNKDLKIIEINSLDDIQQAI